MLKGDNFVSLFFHKNKPVLGIFWTYFAGDIHKFLRNIPVDKE